MFKLFVNFLDSSAWLEVQIRFLSHNLVVEIDWLISIESMGQNVKEEKHAQEMGPNIYRFVVEPKQAFEQFPVAIEIYSVSPQDVFVM